MVESEASILSKDVMLGAVMYGHEQLQSVITAVNEFAAEVNTPKWDWQPAAKNEPLIEKVRAFAAERIGAAYKLSDKAERHDALNLVRNEMLTAFKAEDEELNE